MTKDERPRILVVEDDVLMQRSLTRLLERRLDADVTALSSSLDAVALVQSGVRFDAAVLDLELPEMDGAELVERLADLSPDLPAGLWSGSDRLFDLSTRAAFAVSKTQPVADVLAAVGWVLERRRPMQSTVVPRRQSADQEPRTEHDGAPSVQRVVGGDEPEPSEGTNGS